MTKAPSTSIKDMLIDNISEFPRDVVEKVILFQGEDFQRAVRQHNTIEISGFGVLYVAKGKLNRRLIAWERALERGTSPVMEKRLQDAVEILKKKKCQLLENT